MPGHDVEYVPALAARGYRIMKFGIFDHIDDAGVPLGQLYADRLTIAEAYDRAGFHGYHVAEHHITPLGSAASPALILSALAYRTKQLRFGPMVYLLPFYHPLRLIEEVCMLDHMSGGRFQLGVGRGVSIYETQAYGLDFAKTQAMYHEAFQVLLKGLSSDELSFAGEFYKFDRQPMVLKPVQKPHPPLWYGVNLPGNAAWPAENNVNIIVLGLRDTAAATIKAYREARAAKRLDQDGTLIGLSRHIVVADTDEAALAIARRAYPRWQSSFRWLFNRHGTEPRVIGIYPPTFDELLKLNNGCAGSPETVRRFVESEIKTHNCNYFVPQMVFGSMSLPEALRSIELFAKEIMPAFADPKRAA
jgi:alkanesulfonate monooxygenase SsuD/methylene tetrahydromethanopterin reductase-like flavin-dependent oxidoreductase (luciferase family)